MKDRLTEKKRDDQLAPLFRTGWQMVEGRDAIHKTFVFTSFVEAFGWMTKIAIRAEKMNHHPEWANVYRTVDIYLTTHEVQGVSDRDFDLMDAINRIIA